MPETIPNVQLTAWREGREWTRFEMADELNRTQVAQQKGLVCDEERIRRWERGEVLWPHPPYRFALQELTGHTVEELGFVPPAQQKERRLIVANRMSPVDALQAEANLFDTFELSRMADASDVGPGAIEAIEEAVDLLCRAPRAYETAPEVRHETAERPADPVSTS
jgi:transcriptional regulator with XRE-family HTH domain